MPDNEAFDAKSLLRRIAADFYWDRRGQDSRETLRGVARFLVALRLPIPRGHEYTKTNDGGYLVFLSPYGCTLRISDKKEAPSVDHAHVLQPLLRRDTGSFRIELYPGVEIPADEKDMNGLWDIRYDTGDHNNAGYLPALPDGRRPVVVLDPGGVKRLWRSVLNVKELLRHIGIVSSPQDIVFGPLKKAFGEALPAAKKPDPQKVRKAWENCVDMKKAGKLVASWETDTSLRDNSKNIYQGSMKYAARLDAALR